MNKKLISLAKMAVSSMGLLVLFNIVMEKHGNSDVLRERTVYDFAMGTSISVTLYGDVDKTMVAGDIVKSAQSLSESVISWRTEGSLMHQLNNSYIAGEEYRLDKELYTVLRASHDISVKSRGAMDISIRPLADLWNIEGNMPGEFSVPDEEQLKTALKNVGYEAVTFTDEGIIIHKNDFILDLGATGKGYALDKAREIIKNTSVEGALITMGGSVLVYGTKDDGTPWNIGIRDPEGGENDMIGYLTFDEKTNLCVSTSGGYEKYVEKDGIIYHHILDRNTGYPSDSGLASVTVVCENGLNSDGLSTACFVLGYDNSLELLEEYEAEAVFVLEDGRIAVTSGLEDSFNASK